MLSIGACFLTSASSRLDGMEVAARCPNNLRCTLVPVLPMSKKISEAIRNAITHSKKYSVILHYEVNS